MAKLLFHVLIFTFLGCSQAIQACVKEDPCTCHIDDYSFINLSQLELPDGKFYEDGKDEVFYYFSGCKDRDFKSQDYKLQANINLTGSLIRCQPTVVKLTNVTLPPGAVAINENCTVIGHHKDIKFNLIPSTKPDDKEYQIVYQNPNETSLPTIALHCDSLNKTYLKISSTDTHALILFSPQACVQHIEHHEMSGGSVFCLIFFVAALVYFGGGGLLMYFIRGARGVEVIPNYDFWVALPGLIRDGTVYLLSGCRPFTVSTAETYDRI